MKPASGKQANHSSSLEPATLTGNLLASMRNAIAQEQTPSSGVMILSVFYASVNSIPVFL
jgi:hypothetical protein